MNIKLIIGITLFLLFKMLTNIWMLSLNQSIENLGKQKIELYEHYNSLIIEYENLSKKLPLDSLAQKLNMLDIEANDFRVLDFDLKVLQNALYGD